MLGVTVFAPTRALNPLASRSRYVQMTFEPLTKGYALHPRVVKCRCPQDAEA